MALEVVIAEVGAAVVRWVVVSMTAEVVTIHNVSNRHHHIFNTCRRSSNTFLHILFSTAAAITNSRSRSNNRNNTFSIRP